ncbi:MAG: rhamnogalacturonan lyase [Prevotellaceae bacterium]|nr:rhamnogalacturonan lyase [Prevotellaceae bacterium]
MKRQFFLLFAWIWTVMFVHLSARETLDRAPVALPAQGGAGEFVSWRLLPTDDAATTFDVVRDGQAVATMLTAATCYVDADGLPSSRYQIVVRRDGKEVERTEEFTPWADVFRQLRLERPSPRYFPNDCSVGDVDGDGRYELIVKWEPRNAHDNSHGGQTDNVLIDCYRMDDGRRLWRIDLGRNIRAGAHYTQMVVADLDGDGCAELLCKTAPGSVDAMGQFVSQAATDRRLRCDNAASYVNGRGYVLGGEEFLTLFDGRSGCARHTIYYRPNRAGEWGGAASMPDKSFWGDDYGNRCDRYLACAARLGDDGKRLSAVFGRGYYTRAYLWAVDFDGKRLTTRWLHASVSPTEVYVTDRKGKTRQYIYERSTSGRGSCTLYGNGNHNLSVGDVDGDGRDEILYGSAAVDDDGTLLYATGYGHGDAIHFGDLMPDREGLEIFQVHENRGTYSWDVHDAATGEVLLRGKNTRTDNGRGLAADVLPSHRGYELWSADDRSVRSATTGEVLAEVQPSINFRIYWDGDAQDELLDACRITKVTEDGIVTLADFRAYGNSADCNGTKHTPCLQADLLGDWREEVLLWDMSDGCTLNIFTTNLPTQLRVPTLMSDHVYRMGIVWQNVAYNQPPHLGYYLPDRVR